MVTATSMLPLSNYVWNNSTVPDDRSRLLAMLSPLEHGLQHAEIQESRVKGVGEWLVQTEEFRRWNGLEGEDRGDEAVLFCYGGPGVGKTFIRYQAVFTRKIRELVLTGCADSSLVVDRLRDQARQNTAVTSFCLDFAVRKELTATAILGSLLKQLINGITTLPENISRGLKEEMSTINGHRWQLAGIVKILQLITSSQPTFMCIDGLDQCLRAQRVMVLDSLELIVKKAPGTRIFMTGGPQIRGEIEERLAGRVISVSICPSKDDIITYLRARLAEDETPDAMDESLEADILKKIPENISGM